jgi:hypothetical protein
MPGELAFLLPGMSAGDFDFFSQLGIAEQRGPSQQRVRNRDERSGAPDARDPDRWAAGEQAIDAFFDHT